jgi:hypothetical protein
MHVRLRERIRALETGAHPPKVRQGGYGRNRHWTQLGLRNVTGGGAIYWRVRSDHVYFRTTGLVTVTDPTQFFATIGPAGRPSYIECVLTSDAAAAVEITPDGNFWVVLGNTVKLSRGYSLG